MKLRVGEKCPIHGKYQGCCGRAERKSRQSRMEGPIHWTADGRVLCSPAEMRRRLVKLLEKQDSLCALCQRPISDTREAVIDHIQPRGMGAGSRNDDWSNIQAAHKLCNQQKGSIRNYHPRDRKSAAAGERD